MKIVNSGEKYMIFPNNLNTYDRLPSKAYGISFSKMSGFSLYEHSTIELPKEKIYGVHMSKVNKTISSFEKSQRNFGVILSGNKGMGKSLFSKILTLKAIEKDIPVIIVDEYIPGIASFIASIDQEVMIMFDEFDKTFKSIDNGDINPQEELLSLIDGFNTGKKLFIVTCNKIGMLNDYFINRTGRFHYHFRFSYPSFDEIREYVSDNVDDKKVYEREIEHILNFSSRIDVNYDTLRSVVFELNNGETFSEAIKDLNVLNIGAVCYNIVIEYNDGRITKTREQLDLFSEKSRITCRYSTEDGISHDYISLNNSDIIMDRSGEMIVYNAENSMPVKISRIRITKENQGNLSFDVMGNTSDISKVYREFEDSVTYCD